MFDRFVKRRFFTLLGWVLHVANTRPHIIRRNEFYELKTKLLKRWGEPDGLDVQHIYKMCWTCDGSGRYGRQECRKCYGTGAYQNYYTLLQRYRLGGYSFHRPLDRSRAAYSTPTKDLPVTIEGYINHPYLGGYKATEANYWLFFFFAPRVFWRTIGHVGHRVSSIRQGMLFCAIGGLLFKLQGLPSLPGRIRDKRRYAQYLKHREREERDNPTNEIPF